MKKASKILFIVGLVISIITAVASIAMIIYIIAFIFIPNGFTTVLFEGVPEKPERDSGLYALGLIIYNAALLLISLCFIELMVSIAAIIIASINYNKIKNGSMTVGSRIAIIVAGGISDNILFIISGILGLISRSKELKNSNNETGNETKQN